MDRPLQVLHIFLVRLEAIVLLRPIHYSVLQ